MKILFVIGSVYNVDTQTCVPNHNLKNTINTDHRIKY